MCVRENVYVRVHFRQSVQNNFETEITIERMLVVFPILVIHSYNGKQ